MKKQFLDDLIKIADKLDAAGLVQQANDVDALIRIAYKGEHTRAVADFAEALKEAFKHADPSKVDPAAAISIVDSLLANGVFLNPNMDPNDMVEMTDVVHVFVNSWAALYDDLPKINDEIAKEQNHDQLRLLNRERDDIVKRLIEREKELMELKNSRRDTERRRYEEIVSALAERGKLNWKQYARKAA